MVGTTDTLSLEEVRVGAHSLDRFREVLGEEGVREGLALAARMRDQLNGRIVWNVNSTAVGGGVAEMLRPLLSYTRGAGIDTRWLVIRGDDTFFRITKRLHHALHGASGDGSSLGPAERAHYEEIAAGNARELSALLSPGDVVLLHDPQTAGIAPHLRGTGAHVVWRCHIGHDAAGAEVDRGWGFLAPYLEEVPVFIFSRRAYVPDFCDHGRSVIIPPSIDPFAPKNQELDGETVRSILVHVGLVEGPPPDVPPSFLRTDGSPGRVGRRADVLRLGRGPDWETPLVTQVSRWDDLKDPIGVLQGFASTVGAASPRCAELVLAGPDVRAVADDPEGARVFDDVVRAWRELPDAVRNRIHLASLPTADVDENAAIVNALQRHSAVVVQKSLHEGFGLTVTEAMWKGRAVIASAVGGIRDQIEDGVSGLLLGDPADGDEFVAALRRALGEPGLAVRLGAAARERVREQFLGFRHLMEYARLIEALDRGDYVRRDRT